MIVIGIDPHKSTHTATALDSATNTDLGSIRIDASVIEYKRLIVWAKAWPDRRWAIENADGLGHHLALWLLAIGEVVHDIPTPGREPGRRIPQVAGTWTAGPQGRKVDQDFRLLDQEDHRNRHRDRRGNHPPRSTVARASVFPSPRYPAAARCIIRPVRYATG